MTPFDALAAIWLALAQWGGQALPTPLAQEPQQATEPAAREDRAAALLGLTDDELRGQVESDPGSLGSLSIGTPSGGRVLNAVQLPEDPRWEIAPAAISWGTAETMAAIGVAVETVHELFPDTPPILIGDIGHPEGGRLKRHETHQSGRDVDFGFYHLPGTGGWYARGTAGNLDLARNWALVRALVVCTDVERVLLDTRIQRLLYKHALAVGEDREWLDRVFQFSRGARDAIVRHVAGHRTHYHVRFFNPVAQELGRRAHPFLVQQGVVPPPVYSISHVIRPGQTLGHLARRYGVPVSAIRRLNGLRTTRLRAGRAYRIPMRAAAPPPDPVVIPPRLLPPDTPEALSAFEWPTGAGSSMSPGAR
jgi:penicillin-insensitive murein endopeptidase